MTELLPNAVPVSNRVAAWRGGVIDRSIILTDTANRYMPRLLLVDDDPLVLRVYRDALVRHGFEVATAGDGVTAIRALHAAPPELVILDLLMPKLSGAEVVKFMQSRPELEKIPIIVLSNAYMDALAWDAAVSGAHRGLVKTRCTAAMLIDTIREILAGGKPIGEVSDLLAAQQPEPVRAPAPGPPPATAAPPAPAAPLPKAALRKPAPPAAVTVANADLELKAKATQDFLAQAPTKFAEVRSLAEAFGRAKSTPERLLRLESLYRRVHFLAAEAGLAGCQRLALLTAAFEALLMQLMDKPARITPSAGRTLTLGLHVLDHLCRQADSAIQPMAAVNVLVVDDDAISNRLAVSALRQIGMAAASFDLPLPALEHLKKKRYDLLLLDIQMPGMSGFDFCRNLRRIAGYEKTPVIYVTGHTDFAHLAKSLETGAEDLIAKPVLPMELAVKVLIHLLRRDEPARQGSRVAGP